MFTKIFFYFSGIFFGLSDVRRGDDSTFKRRNRQKVSAVERRQRQGQKVRKTGGKGERRRRRQSLNRNLAI